MSNCFSFTLPVFLEGVLNRYSGMRTDVDREFVIMFTLVDENQSWYLDENIRHFCTDPNSVDKTDAVFQRSNKMHGECLPWAQMHSGASAWWETWGKQDRWEPGPHSARWCRLGRQWFESDVRYSTPWIPMIWGRTRPGTPATLSRQVLHCTDKTVQKTEGNLIIRKGLNTEVSPEDGWIEAVRGRIKSHHITTLCLSSNYLPSFWEIVRTMLCTEFKCILVNLLFPGHSLNHQDLVNTCCTPDLCTLSCKRKELQYVMRSESESRPSGMDWGQGICTRDLPERARTRRSTVDAFPFDCLCF